MAHSLKPESFYLLIYLIYVFVLLCFGVVLLCSELTSALVVFRGPYVLPALLQCQHLSHYTIFPDPKPKSLKQNLLCFKL